MIRTLCLSAALGLSGALYSASAQQIGVNAVIKNEVTQKSEVETAFRDAEVGGDVLLKDTILSGEDAALQVLLLDETVFTVGPKAELVVDRFIYDPDQNTGEMAASVARGAFRFMSGRTARTPQNVEINTPVASMGVRGTIVEGAIGLEAISAVQGLNLELIDTPLGEDAALIVLRGPGEDNNGLNREGAVDVTNEWGTVTLTEPNTAVLVSSLTGQIIGPFPLPPQALDGFSAALRTTPTGEAENPILPLILPFTLELDGDPLDVFAGENDDDAVGDQIEDRPIAACPIDNGIPVTNGGIILDGTRDVIDDFGSFDCLE